MRRIALLVFLRVMCWITQSVPINVLLNTAKLALPMEFVNLACLAIIFQMDNATLALEIAKRVHLNQNALLVKALHTLIQEARNAILAVVIVNIV